MEEKKKDVKTIIIGIESIVIIVLLAIIAVLLTRPTKVTNTSSTSDTTSYQETTLNSSNNNSGITTNKNNTSTTPTSVELELNETATKDGKYELTVVGTNFAKKILPPNTSRYYTYYEAKEDGHQYLEVKYNYKNLDTSGVDADDVVSMRIKYNNQYEYTGFCVIEDSDSDFTYASITDIAPLTTGKLHYLFDIPDEVANGTEPIVATLTVGTDVYTFNVR